MELKCASVRLKNGIISALFLLWESGKEQVSARNKNMPFCLYAQRVVISLLAD